MILDGTLNSRKNAPRIDAHQHLWRYTPEEFGWIASNMAEIRHDFLPTDLERELDLAGIDATIAVQARCSLEETEFLFDCASKTTRIAGIVGWVPLMKCDPSLLDQLAANPLLVGVREVAQGQPAGFFDQAAFDAGIGELTARDLGYDILIYCDQIVEATRLVDRHPHQRFILNHAAKPHIAIEQLEPWRTRIHALAERPNVVCKLSGLVTEADWAHWTPDHLKPYLDTCVEAFTPARLLAGSDWPVCLVASSYTCWWTTLHDFFAPFTPDEQAAVFGLNAKQVYKLHERQDA